MPILNKTRIIILSILNLFLNAPVQSAQPCFGGESSKQTPIINQDTTAKGKSTNPEKADIIAIDTVKIEKKWDFANTYIGGSVSWKNQEGNKESDYEFRFGTSLSGRLDKIDLKLESQYKSRKESQDDNEQYARINWYHTFYRQFYFIGQGQLERDQLSLQGNRFDYILLQEGVGPGYNLKIKKIGESRISVLYNFIQIYIFDIDYPVNQQAFSFYMDNNYNLTKKINLSNWTNIIFWDKNDIGFDVETEIMYKFTKNLGLGFRHTYFFNGPTLQKTKSSELKIFIKITI